MKPGQSRAQNAQALPNSALPHSNRALVIYILLSLGAAWLVSIPLWMVHPDLSPQAPTVTGLGDESTLYPSTLLPLLVFQLTTFVMMLTPAAAAIITLLVHRVPLRRVFVLLGAATPVQVPGFVAPKRRVWPFIRNLLLAFCLTLVLSVLIAGLLVLVTPASFGPNVWIVEKAQALGLPLGVYVAMLLAPIPVAAFFLNVIPSLGEELGWRGFLYPALTTRFGFPGAVVIGGAIWGLWHAPLIMQGYNFGLFGLPGVGLMMVGCIGLGAWLAYLYGKSGSVWASAVAHGTFNACAGLVFLLWPTGVTYNGATDTPLGVWSWVVFVPLTLAIVLGVSRASQARAGAPEKQ